MYLFIKFANTPTPLAPDVIEHGMDTKENRKEEGGGRAIREVMEGSLGPLGIDQHILQGLGVLAFDLALLHQACHMLQVGN